MPNCPCCSSPMLRHFHRGHLFWRCRHCWQEMPDLTATQALILNYTPSLEKTIKKLAVV